jgi:uncharacterized protein involved in exopolysaccharide biosynthesis
MYEQAKVEEVRNTPSVLVLDYAGPADRKAKPKGSIYLVISFLASMFVGLIIVFSLEGINKMKKLSTDNYEYIRKSLKFRRKKTEL